MTTENLPDGYYEAKPTCGGMTRKEPREGSEEPGKVNYTIELQLLVPQSDPPRFVTRTKFGTIDDRDTDDSVGYTARDAETCGCDINKNPAEWVVDTNRTVNVKLVTSAAASNNDKTYQNMQIYPLRPYEQKPGLLVNKYKVEGAEAVSLGANTAKRLQKIRETAAAMAGNGAPPVKENVKNNSKAMF